MGTCHIFMFCAPVAITCSKDHSSVNITPSQIHKEREKEGRAWQQSCLPCYPIVLSHSHLQAEAMLQKCKFSDHVSVSSSFFRCKDFAKQVQKCHNFD